MNSLLNERVIGSWMLSIGTSLAMESVKMGPGDPYDAARVPPDKCDLAKYSGVYVNLATLCRNIITAVATAEQLNLKAADVAECLDAEVSLITDIVKEASGSTPAHFYYCEHEGIAKRLPGAMFRGFSTDKDREVTKSEQIRKLSHEAISAYFRKYAAKHRQAHGENTIQLHHHELVYSSVQKALIITHEPVDLCVSGKVDLLETHTGKLKRAADFYTKFSNHEQLARIPMCMAMLMVFGDSTHFKAWPASTRAEVIGIAKDKSWDYRTTAQRMRVNLDANMKDKLALRYILSAL